MFMAQLSGSESYRSFQSAERNMRPHAPHPSGKYVGKTERVGWKGTETMRNAEALFGEADFVPGHSCDKGTHVARRIVRRTFWYYS
jgi:hypothetical protein